MPYKSQAQRAYLHAKMPELAKKWDKETPKGKKLPKRAKAASARRDSLHGRKRDDSNGRFG